MTFYIYRDKDGFWRWYLENHAEKRIAEGAEAHVTKEECLTDIALIQSSTEAKLVTLEGTYIAE